MIRDRKGKWLDSSVFRQEAIKFLEKGYYTEAPYGTPEWLDYWKEQLRRCIEGYEVEGQKITGHHYCYLNFAQIERVEYRDGDEDDEEALANKITSFPDFWDGDYNFFWSLEIARNGICSKHTQVPSTDSEKTKWNTLNKKLKKLDKTSEEYFKIKQERDKISEDVLGRLGLFVKPHLDYLNGGYHFIVGKARRKGYSFKNGIIIANLYNTVRNKLTLIGAYEKKFIEQTMEKTLGFLNFFNEHTGFSKNRLIDKKDFIKSGYIEEVNGVNVEKGYKSVIDAKRTFKDNADAMRGVDALFILLEEAGAFDNLAQSYNAIVPSLTAGSKITGQICIIGCVCKGTKVYDAQGRLRNIEDISKETGIIGYAGTGVFKEKVTYVSEPKKKPCYRIITSNGKSIECSNDHPLMYSSNSADMRFPTKKVAFKKAEDLKVGEQLISINQIPIFGDKNIPYPRLIGLLIGDGYYGGTSTNLAIADSGIKEFLDSLNVTYKIVKQVDDYMYVNIFGFSDLKRELGIYGDTKLKKHIPYDYHTYTAKTLSEIVGGYFDADGTINYNKKKNSYRISLCSVNLFLLEQVQDILLRFGIHANIYKRKHKPTILRSKVNNKVYDINTEFSYKLEFTNIADVIKFKKQFYFTDKKKQAILDSVDENRCGRLQYDEVQFVNTLPNKGEIFNYTKVGNVRCEYIKSIEYIGEQDVYNLTANTSHTYITNTFISHNTSGDMEKGTVDYADMYYNPLAYGLMPFINIWDDNAENTVCGFFHPVVWNMEGFYDKQGNSDIKKALEWENARRKKLLENSSSSILLHRHMQEFPIKPAEAFAMASHSEIVCIEELRNRLNKIQAKSIHIKKGIPVTLHYNLDRTKVLAKPDLNNNLNPIYNYKPKTNDLNGAVVIYEFPSDKVPQNFYKIGYDPYRQNNGTSLSAITVFKGHWRGEKTKYKIVAEYYGRPQNSDMANEIALKLAMLYNTQVMVENEVTHPITYFERKKALKYLAAQPDRAISNSIQSSKVDRKYGCHMTDKIKEDCIKYTNDWLLNGYEDDFGNTLSVIDEIDCPGFIEELLMYNRKGNFDRVSSFFMCMMQLQEQELEKEYSTSVDRVTEVINFLNKINGRR